MNHFSSIQFRTVKYIHPTEQPIFSTLFIVYTKTLYPLNNSSFPNSVNLLTLPPSLASSRTLISFHPYYVEQFFIIIPKAKLGISDSSLSSAKQSPSPPPPELM